MTEKLSSSDFWKALADNAHIHEMTRDVLRIAWDGLRKPAVEFEDARRCERIADHAGSRASATTGPERDAWRGVELAFRGPLLEILKLEASMDQAIDLSKDPGEDWREILALL